MRTNLLNWCDLVSISKSEVFYAFGMTKKIIMKNSKLRFSENMLNISRSNVFGKFVLVVMVIFVLEMS